MLIRLRNCCRKQVPYPANGGDEYQICRFESPGRHVDPQQHSQSWKQHPVHLPCVDRFTAQNKPQLANLGITHVLNAAHGPQHIDTGPRFYNDANIEYHGVEASDCKDFDLRPFFRDAAEFIHVALRQQGKVLVHCARGISRSATLVLAYLMLREGLTLVEALEAVCRHRNILPNVGFLNQLRQLDASLARQRNKGQIALPEK
ncbi:dual specificity phosphatase DUPD1-like isoform X1 [Takifugu rubripes]|uniref:Dual specificity protein phosphatase n=1 Tax=Takifugu rubripes TaxID=31033 RepID=A0A674PPK1_TAKRU|nr:dual specificity phosphatase DUPD1-like isoform X1 [Takifugu rubripes]